MEQSEKERRERLMKLPVRALVALAARSAMRVRHTFDLPGDTQDRATHMHAVSKAIMVTRRFVEGHEVTEQDLRDAGRSYAAAGAAPPNMFGIPATKAGEAASLVHTYLYGERDLIPNRALSAIPRRPYTGGEEAERDYERLIALNLPQFPELGPPIDMSESGPLGEL